MNWTGVSLSRVRGAVNNRPRRMPCACRPQAVNPASCLGVVTPTLGSPGSSLLISKHSTQQPSSTTLYSFDDWICHTGNPPAHKAAGHVGCTILKLQAVNLAVGVTVRFCAKVKSQPRSTCLGEGRAGRGLDSEAFPPGSCNRMGARATYVSLVVPRGR